jgi:hypothetical protein
VQQRYNNPRAPQPEHQVSWVGSGSTQQHLLQQPVQRYASRRSLDHQVGWVSSGSTPATPATATCTADLQQPSRAATLEHRSVGLSGSHSTSTRLQPVQRASSQHLRSVSVPRHPRTALLPRAHAGGWRGPMWSTRGKKAR